MKFGLYVASQVKKPHIQNFTEIVVFEIQTFKISILEGKRGFPPKFKLSYVLNYWVDFHKTCVILKNNCPQMPFLQ